MANALDNAIILEASTATTPTGTAGTGPLIWSNLGGIKMALFTGTGVPVDGDASWAAAGLGVTSRAFYLREDGAGAATILYFTVDGGAHWTAAAL